MSEPINSQTELLTFRVEYVLSLLVILDCRAIKNVFLLVFNLFIFIKTRCQYLRKRGIEFRMINE